ncbi:MAG TPA: hypothetical protein VHU88_06810 [Sporichthyaceae bacterium]|nr:hypothetical protein [Sporichthyaceae bacterium]
MTSTHPARPTLSAFLRPALLRPALLRPALLRPAFLRRLRPAQPRHDDRLRVGRQVTRPRTSLIALINGGRGPA